jgi:uncharacterized protein (DUF849 family)
MIADVEKKIPGPVAIAVAPNGARKASSDHPQIPLTAEQLARTAAECLEAGAAMMHFHVRDSAGRHLLDADAYRQATAAIRRQVGQALLLQISSEALGEYSVPAQMAMIRAVRPEAVSLALREFAPGAREEQVFARFLRWLQREAIAPQIILYSPAEVRRLAELRKRGLVPWAEVPVIFVLGRHDAPVSAPTELVPFLAPAAPSFNPWMACAFGRLETACLAAAALLGGGVRVGFENNLWRPSGARAASNAAQVASLSRLLRSAGLNPMTGPELRARWSAL